MNAKDWILRRCDKLADSVYGIPFGELSDSQRREIYDRADKEYTDFRSDLDDLIYEKEKDRRMECQSKD